MDFKCVAGPRMHVLDHGDGAHPSSANDHHRPQIGQRHARVLQFHEPQKLLAQLPGDDGSEVGLLHAQEVGGAAQDTHGGGAQLAVFLEQGALAEVRVSTQLPHGDAVHEDLDVTPCDDEERRSRLACCTTTAPHRYRCDTKLLMPIRPFKNHPFQELECPSPLLRITPFF